MRVAIFTETYFPFISGVVTHIETLKNCLEANGHEVLIITTSPKTMCHYRKDDVLYCPAIPLKRIYGYGFSNPVNLQRLKIIQEFNPDIIHIQTEFSMGIFALFAARQLKKPVVYTVHTMYDDYLFYIAPQRLEKMVKPAAHLYFRRIASHATEIIGPSLKVVEFLQRCGVNRHINIIPNTVDLSEFMPENVSQSEIDAVRQKLGINPGDVAMCFVGRLGKEKSIDVQIEYLARHFKGDMRYKLFIIGDGPEKDNLNRQIENLGMQSQVRLLGRIEHDALPPYYHACDAFTTASLSEMNSISMLEAMASGLYVIQRLDIYNKDQIVAGQNGEMYETDVDMARLLQVQGQLTADERKAQRERVIAYTHRYGRNEFLKSVMNVYERSIIAHKQKMKKKK